MICDWFVDKKLSILFGTDKKTELILLSSKRKVRKAIFLIVQCKSKTKYKKSSNTRNQLNQKKYLGCILDQTLSRESVTIHIINNINPRLRLVSRQIKFLDIPFQKILQSQQTLKNVFTGC